MSRIKQEQAKIRLEQAVLQSPAQAIGKEVTAQLDPRFEHQFSQVRVHADAEADQLARDFEARAFTVGQDVFFRAGEYDPASTRGLGLLSHELAHTVQQGQLPPQTRFSSLQISAKDSSIEREARAVGTATALGRAAPTVAPSEPVIARDDYADQAYGIMNSSMTPEDRTQALLAAENRSLAAQGVPTVGAGTLPAGNGSLGEGNFSSWQLDLNQSAPTSNFEQRTDFANTVGHEGEHLNQWYQMARLEAGLGQANGAISEVPQAIADQARANPILQSDANTYRAEQWEDSVYGAGRAHREQVLSQLSGYTEDESAGVSRPLTPQEVSTNNRAYSQLPEERDAWERGMQITARMRELEGAPIPDPEHDPSIPQNSDLMSHDH